jgi:gamma-glutamylcyclotransferase (GGCT)/AIG2-like uncharacterized protein YtfP
LIADMVGSGRPLFVYGSLMFPEIIRSVIGRVPEGRPAIIQGYRRLVVAGESFPGMIKVGESDERVDGLVYVDITSEEWKRIIAFEDEFYGLKEVSVERLGENLSALAFVVPPAKKSLLAEEQWRPDYFREHHLGRLLAETNR